MDNQNNENSKNRTDNFYILSGFTYGPSDPNSLEETRIGGITITVIGPQNTTLVSDPFGNFSSGLLPEGKYKLSFYDPSGKYFRSPIFIDLDHNIPRPVELSILGDKKKKERKENRGIGVPNAIHGFTLDRNLKPLSGITVRVKSVLLEKKKQGILGKVLSTVTSALKRKEITPQGSSPKQEERSINLEVPTNKIGGFSTKKLPNGSYIVSCSDPSGKNKFTSKSVVLKGQTIPPLLFKDDSQEDLEELKKRDLERREKEAEEKAKKEKEGQEQKTEQDKRQQQIQKRQERTRQKLEEQLRKAQAQRTAAQTRATELSRASRESLASRVRMPFANTGRAVTSFGQRGAGFAGQATGNAAKAGIKGAQMGMRVGTQLVFTAARFAMLLVANPVVAIAIGIGIAIAIILFIIFFGGGSPSIPFLSGGGSSGGQSSEGSKSSFPPIPGLTLTLNGPSFINNGELASYSVTVSYDSGKATTPIEEITVFNELPQNTSFSSATGIYKYDSDSRLVSWPLFEPTNRNGFSIILAPTLSDFFLANRVYARAAPASGGTGGVCSEGFSYCSVQNLMNYFPDEAIARKASIICNRESGSNPGALNNGCLNGKSADYSVGLFQINLLAHCPGAFSSYTLSPPSCTVADQSILDQCQTKFSNPDENIKKALELSSNGSSWGAWSAAKVCGIN